MSISGRTFFSLSASGGESRRGKKKKFLNNKQTPDIDDIYVSSCRERILIILFRNVLLMKRT